MDSFFHKKDTSAKSVRSSETMFKEAFHVPSHLTELSVISFFFYSSLHSLFQSKESLPHSSPNVNNLFSCRGHIFLYVFAMHTHDRIRRICRYSSLVHSCGQISCSHENLPAWMYEESAKKWAKMSCKAAESHEVAVLRMARVNCNKNARYAERNKE